MRPCIRRKSLDIGDARARRYRQVYSAYGAGGQEGLDLNFNAVDQRFNDSA